MAGVILQHDELAERIETLKSQGKKIVLAQGCFDVLHVGHVRFLRAAKALGDVLVLALKTDEAVKREKGKGRPLLPLEDRLDILSAFEMVDFVTVFNEDTVEPLLTRLKPNLYARCAGGKEKGKISFGGQLVTLKEGKDHSAEKTIREIVKKYGPLQKKN